MRPPLEAVADVGRYDLRIVAGDRTLVDGSVDAGDFDEIVKAYGAAARAALRNGETLLVSVRDASSTKRDTAARRVIPRRRGEP